MMKTNFETVAHLKQKIFELEARIEKLEAVVDVTKSARDAIASLNPDALGEVVPTHDHGGYWIRDELIHNIRQALAALEEND